MKILPRANGRGNARSLADTYSAFCGAGECEIHYVRRWHEVSIFYLLGDYFLLHENMKSLSITDYPNFWV